MKSLDGEAQTQDAKRGTLIWMFTGGLCCTKRRGQAGGSQQPFFQSYQISLYQNQSQQYEILFSACDTTAPTPHHTIRGLLSYDFCLLIYFNFSSAHAPGTYTIMAITHCTKHINNFSMKEKEKAEIRVL